MQFDFHNKIIDLAGRYAFGVCIAHFDLVGFFPCCRVNTISKGRKEPCLTNIYGDVLLPPVASRQPRWGVPMSLCNIGHLRPPFPMETPSSDVRLVPLEIVLRLFLWRYHVSDHLRYHERRKILVQILLIRKIYLHLQSQGEFA